MTERDPLPIWFQRAESAGLAVVCAVGFVELGFSWWWLLALFLVFDLSMLGYAKGPAVGAWTYNAVHSYIGPAAVGAWAVLQPSRDAAFVALVWTFHIGVDRLLGYGLKLRHRFTSTHLGEIGRERPAP